MILVYPMLVSRAVSENSLAGIAKTLENYIIVHYQDAIINNAALKKQKNAFGKISFKGGKLIIKEIEDLTEAIPDDATKTDHKKDKQKGSKKDGHQMDDDYADTEEDQLRKKRDQARKDLEWQQKQDKLKRDQKKDAEEEKRRAKKEKEEEEARKARTAKADVKVTGMQSISLEPTYINIDKVDKYGNRSSEFLGIKVIPMRVKSDVKLSYLMLYDTRLNALMAAGVAFGRFVTRGVYKFFDRWTKRLRIGGLTPSGDPRRDILMGRTGMNSGTSFIVLSKQEDIDETFLDNIQKINRLFKMGWGNFVIADDISRQAYFCMRKFRGMCTSIPYAMMYQYLGQSKAYESMEDAKKANSSIFKVSKRFSRVIGEWRVAHKLDKYSKLNEGN